MRTCTLCRFPARFEAGTLWHRNIFGSFRWKKRHVERADRMRALTLAEIYFINMVP